MSGNYDTFSRAGGSERRPGKGDPNRPTERNGLAVQRETRVGLVHHFSLPVAPTDPTMYSAEQIRTAEGHLREVRPTHLD